MSTVLAATVVESRVVQENVPDPDQTKVWRKYRLLVGCHRGATRYGNMVQDFVLNHDGKKVEYGNPRFVPYSHTWDATEPTNNIVETHLDLVKLFNHPYVGRNGNKFADLHSEPAAMSPAELRRLADDKEKAQQAVANASKPEVPESDTLSHMSKKELLKLGEELEIDLSTCNTREEMINSLRSARP